VAADVSLVDRVTRLLDEVVAAEVMTRFRQLAHGDVEAKVTASDPDDLVTVADRMVEARLEAALPALVPGSRVLGEEAVHAAPERLRLLEDEGPVWLVDPIDGTRNFARGEESFGVMVALVVAGTTRAAWIALPARRETFVAEAGSGAWLAGQRLRAPVPASPLRGTFYTGFMPEALAATVARATAGRYVPQSAPGAAAVEYTGLVRGEKDLVVYHRLHPWDHAPGALILTEAGGCVEHLDGRPYTPRSTGQVTIAGTGASVPAAVRTWLR
jgi:fructose-1,6-bisphosphatase/inositol monophosphatase family enzyme